MSRGIRYTDEFKQEAVNQVALHGYSVLDVSMYPVSPSWT